jgi:hypothetical protein
MISHANSQPQQPALHHLLSITGETHSLPLSLLIRLQILKPHHILLNPLLSRSRPCILRGLSTLPLQPLLRHSSRILVRSNLRRKIRILRLITIESALGDIPALRLHLPLVQHIARHTPDLGWRRVSFRVHSVLLSARVSRPRLGQARGIFAAAAAVAGLSPSPTPIPMLIMRARELRRSARSLWILQPTRAFQFGALVPRFLAFARLSVRGGRENFGAGSVLVGEGGGIAFDG